MKRVLAVLGAVAALLCLVPTVHGQATVAQTTLAAALDATARQAQLASAAGVVAGQTYLYVDREMLQVSAIGGVEATVVRGVNGTSAAAHANATVVWLGPSTHFNLAEPAGACVPTAEIALPRIVAIPGKIFDCVGGLWTRYSDGGFATFTSNVATSYTTAGALAVKPGLTLISGAGAIAMTLPTPTAGMNGMIMTIQSTTAMAHTITTPAGFNGGAAARDVCTMAAAIGSSITIQAMNGIWYLIANIGCTLA